MSLKVAVQMDHIAGINIAGDSTFALMLEAQAHGHTLLHYHVRDLAQRCVPADGLEPAAPLGPAPPQRMEQPSRRRHPRLIVLYLGAKNAARDRMVLGTRDPHHPAVFGPGDPGATVLTIERTTSLDFHGRLSELSSRPATITPFPPLVKPMAHGSHAVRWRACSVRGRGRRAKHRLSLSRGIP